MNYWARVEVDQNEMESFEISLKNTSKSLPNDGCCFGTSSVQRNHMDQNLFNLNNYVSWNSSRIQKPHSTDIQLRQPHSTLQLILQVWYAFRKLSCILSCWIANYFCFCEHSGWDPEKNYFRSMEKINCQYFVLHESFWWLTDAALMSTYSTVFLYISPLIHIYVQNKYTI